ncbi:hypothetical protein ACHAAC_07560 [Aeromicrobium sp. CF4.19]|uniref:hypothetical protein n=1 Tax=Aeromicrobium sp. CF4.19 TaxID=3373082 RepID=UPI003EE49551
MTTILKSRRAAAAAVSCLALVLAACSGESDESEAGSAEGSAEGRELEAGRVAVTYDGGVMVLEGGTLEVVDELSLGGFLRASPMGDGRHVAVSRDGGFTLLDTGVDVEEHGDHNHYRVAGDVAWGAEHEAPEPGHVVTHAGRTALFSDGTGEIELLDALDPSRGVGEASVDEPHHGVAVPLEGDRLLVTTGNAEERNGAEVLADGETESSTNECPGVHGETVAAQGRVVLGCEDGAVVLDRDGFTKIDGPGDYARSGNLAGSEASPVVLADHKVDAEAELERPEQIALFDTEQGEVDLVDLGTSYTFRSLGRGPEGEALVLGTDGALHVIDEESGEKVDAIDVLDDWKEPVDWQRPRPALEVVGDLAYVTDPAGSAIHVVDLALGQVTETVELPHAPDEIVAAAH